VPLFAAAASVLGFTALGGTGLASAAPAAQATASPSPEPSKKPSVFSMKIDTYTSATNQQFVGPGISPPEAATFAQGGVQAPISPYALFSGAPLVTGQGTAQDFLLTPTFAVNPHIDAAVTIGYGSASGTGNVINYWGDPIMPSINPNLGVKAFTLAPAFPTHNGADAASATRLGFLSASVTEHSGLGGLTIGWFSPHQVVPFAFAPPPGENTPFQPVPQLANNIGDGTPSIDVLKAPPPILPLSGVDLWLKDGIATLEFASGILPAPVTSTARAQTLSAIFDHGNGLSYSAELAGLTTNGPETARVLFGSNGQLVNGVPQSTVYGQHMAVLGLGATLPLGVSDGSFRYGYSCYGANQGAAISTGNCTSGNYYYGKIHHGFTHFDLSLEGERYEPNYAPALLDYGTIENVWQSPAALPSTWLLGDYSFVGGAIGGANRQGARLSTTFIIAGVEVRFAVAGYTEISPLDTSTAFTPGFVEPYFLPQNVAHGNLGNEQRYEGWFSYHAKFGDIVLDLSQVNTSRTAPAGSPGDRVSMSYPSGVFSITRPFGPKVTGSAGVGRFALNGQFDTSGPNNASLAQDLVFAGVQLRSNATSGYGLEYRLYSTQGNPSLPGGPSPAYHGPQIQFYQRFKT
jgi:hypothetical protein